MSRRETFSILAKNIGKGLKLGVKDGFFVGVQGAALEMIQRGEELDPISASSKEDITAFENLKNFLSTRIPRSLDEESFTIQKHMHEKMYGVHVDSHELFIEEDAASNIFHLLTPFEFEQLRPKDGKEVLGNEQVLLGDLLLELTRTGRKGLLDQEFPIRLNSPHSYRGVPWQISFIDGEDRYYGKKDKDLPEDYTVGHAIKVVRSAMRKSFRSRKDGFMACMGPFTPVNISDYYQSGHGLTWNMLSNALGYESFDMVNLNYRNYQ